LKIIFLNKTILFYKKYQIDNFYKINNHSLNIYTDYLQVSYGRATATDLSCMVDGSVSRDQITHLL